MLNEGVQLLATVMNGSHKQQQTKKATYKIIYTVWPIHIKFKARQN